MVGDNDGSIAGFGEAAKVENDRKDGGEAGFAATAQEVGEGICDDEAGVLRLSELDEFVSGILIAQGMASQGMDVDRRFRSGAVSVEGSVEASEELAGTGLLVDEEHWSLGDWMIEPGFAHGNANSQIDDGEGFLGTRIADEDGEAGAGEKAFDAPFEGRRRSQRIGNGELDSGKLGMIFGRGVFVGRGNPPWYRMRLVKHG